MKTDNQNNEALVMAYPRALKYMALAGILLGVSDIWFAFNNLWLHWPGSAQILLVTTELFIFACFWMIFSSHRSVAQICMWLGMAYIALTQMFMTLLWPGGTMMGCYGVISLLTICAAIWYLYKIDEPYRWSRKAMGIWVIVIQVAFIILWYAKMYYLNYVVDQFEPAIPYAEHSVYYMQNRIWCRKYIVMGNGIAMLLSSIYLYIKIRKHK